MEAAFRHNRKALKFSNNISHKSSLGLVVRDMILIRNYGLVGHSVYCAFERRVGWELSWKSGRNGFMINDLL